MLGVHTILRTAKRRKVLPVIEAVNMSCNTPRHRDGLNEPEGPLVREYSQ